MNKFLPQSLRNAFAHHSNQCALSWSDGEGKPASLSYAELEKLILSLAETIRAHAPAKSGVALLTDKSPGSYAAILAPWFADAFSVPLSTKWPLARCQAALDLVKIVFYDEALEQEVGKWKKNFSHISFFSLPAKKEALLKKYTHSGAKEKFGDSTDLAYVIHSSGSSGIPKGIKISHANLSAYAEAALPLYNFSPRDRFTQVFEQSFDPFFSDLLWAFLSGATLCPASIWDLTNIDAFLKREKISIWSSAPSIAAAALESNSIPCNSLRLSTFIGESLKKDFLKKWRTLAPNSALENLYGPAETTISVTRWHLAANKALPDRDPPIGESIGPELLVREEELWIGGDQVAMAYTNADNKAFVKEKIPGKKSERWYRSGDRVREEANELYFLGRIDNQVKIHGVRLEPEELERIATLAGLTNPVALSWPEPADFFVLVLAKEPTSKELEKLNELSEKNLPAVAQAKFYLCLKTYPLNSSGKIDRKKLREQITEKNFIRI